MKNAEIFYWDTDDRIPGVSVTLSAISSLRVGMPVDKCSRDNKYRMGTNGFSAKYTMSREWASLRPQKTLPHAPGEEKNKKFIKVDNTLSAANNLFLTLKDKKYFTKTWSFDSTQAQDRLLRPPPAFYPSCEKAAERNYFLHLQPLFLRDVNHGPSSGHNTSGNARFYDMHDTASEAKRVRLHYPLAWVPAEVRMGDAPDDFQQNEEDDGVKTFFKGVEDYGTLALANLKNFWEHAFHPKSSEKLVTEDGSARDRCSEHFKRGAMYRRGLIEGLSGAEVKGGEFADSSIIIEDESPFLFP